MINFDAYDLVNAIEEVLYECTDAEEIKCKKDQMIMLVNHLYEKEKERRESPIEGEIFTTVSSDDWDWLK